MPSGGQWLRTIEHSNIVETQKAALKHVHAIRILAIYPPREIQQEFVKHTLKETSVGAPANAFFNFVNAPRSPRVHWRIDVPERPLISRQLPVRMHIPLAQQQNNLVLG